MFRLEMYIRNSSKKKKSGWRALSLFFVIAGGAAAVALMQVSQELFSRATYIPADLQVDGAAVIGPLPRPWANLAQGGEDHAWRLAPLANEVRALRPEYIRLDHLYDFYDIVSGSSGNLQFDFSKLDPLLDDIKAVGATPYIALSYTPTQLSADGSIVGKPSNYQDWQVIVTRTIQHISGTRNIPNVYYEVWNEPDLFGDWKYYGSKNYLDLYAASARGANNVGNTQPFKLGGPAITALYKNWVIALAEYAQKNQLRLDFISWHRYNRDIDQYRQDMINVRNWLNDTTVAVNDLEYHVTEWGHDSEIDPGYDTAYGAAHTVAGAIEMIGYIERAFVFEIQDGKSPEGKPYWGRWGLFTHESAGSVAKPRYKALLMLNQLGSERLQLLGKGSFVKAVATRDENGAIVIAMANFDPAGRSRETVPLTLRNIPMTQNQVTITYLSKAPLKVTATPTEDGTGLFAFIPMAPNDVAVVKVDVSL